MDMKIRYKAVTYSKWRVGSAQSQGAAGLEMGSKGQGGVGGSWSQQAPGREASYAGNFLPLQPPLMPITTVEQIYLLAALGKFSKQYLRSSFRLVLKIQIQSRAGSFLNQILVNNWQLGDFTSYQNGRKSPLFFPLNAEMLGKRICSWKKRWVAGRGEVRKIPRVLDGTVRASMHLGVGWGCQELMIHGVVILRKTWEQLWERNRRSQVTGKHHPGLLRGWMREASSGTSSCVSRDHFVATSLSLFLWPHRVEISREMEVIRRKRERREVWEKGELKGRARRDKRRAGGNGVNLCSPPLLCPSYIPCEEVICEKGGCHWLKPMHTGSTTIIIWTTRTSSLCGSINICWINLKAKWFFFFNVYHPNDCSQSFLCMSRRTMRALAVVKWMSDFMIEFVPCSLTLKV